MKHILLFICLLVVASCQTATENSLTPNNLSGSNSLTNSAASANIPESGVSIYLLKRRPGQVASALQKQTAGTVLAQINRLRKYERQYITLNEAQHSVVYVFHSDLPIGTKIRTEHQWYKLPKGWFRPSRFGYVITENNAAQPLVIVNMSRSGGTRGGTLNYRAYIDGKLIAEKAVSLGRP
jgi:hypothetical protein